MKGGFGGTGKKFVGSEGAFRNRYHGVRGRRRCQILGAWLLFGFVTWMLVRSRVSGGEGDGEQGPEAIRSYLLGRDWGREGGREANEQETCQEAVTVIGGYL